MHPNAAFKVDDTAHLLAFVAERAFGQVIAQTREGLRAASVPMLVGAPEAEDAIATLRMHLARGNALFRALSDGADVLVTVQGPDAYISPDWYESPAQVPTWNYICVHLHGRGRALDAPGRTVGLESQMDDLSHTHETRLAPKPLWTRDKVPDDVQARMMRAIGAFAIDVTAAEGTWKLSQNKSAADRAGAIAALEELGTPDARAVAAAMRAAEPPAQG